LELKAHEEFQEKHRNVHNSMSESKLLDSELSVKRNELCELRSNIVTEQAVLANLRLTLLNEESRYYGYQMQMKSSEEEKEEIQKLISQEKRILENVRDEINISIWEMDQLDRIPPLQKTKKFKFTVTK
jgi:transcriptional regulator with PAS, ATPase and Fis domain